MKGLLYKMYHISNYLLNFSVELLNNYIFVGLNPFA